MRGGWRVTAIDAAARLVSIDGTRVLPCDTLVYAVGAVADTTVPGVDVHAWTLDSASVPRRWPTGWPTRRPPPWRYAAPG